MLTGHLPLGRLRTLAGAAPPCPDASAPPSVSPKRPMESALAGPTRRRASLWPVVLRRCMG